MIKNNILIPGGAGFIGSNLAERLVQTGYRVFVVDNLVTGSLGNISKLLNNENFSFIQADITDANIRSFLPTHIDTIVNLACIASPKAYYARPIETLLTSVIGVKHLLDFADTSNATLIQASTSEIYGDPDKEVLEESYNGNVNCIGLRACYDEGKRAAETLCMDYQRMRGTKVNIIRIFNTYGPNMASEDGRAIPEFICRALLNEDLLIFGSGNQTRSFMYIDDLVEAIIKLIESEKVFESPINLGNPAEEHTIEELAKSIISLTRSFSKITYCDKLADDPRKRRPSITKANNMLNWSPRTSLHEGLLKTINYFQTNG